jgi:hypothetical protein
MIESLLKLCAPKS